jgi:cyclopropane fatty-acyl-phospholipid synthase-like methyltransferase
MNRESYNAIAGQWDASRSAFNGREREYVDALLDGLPDGSHVLDLGCGTGRPIAEAILARGHRVTGVDQAESLLEIACGRHREAVWIHSTIQAFTTPELYDAIVCWDALFHIERSQHEELIARFASMLRGGGRLMLSFGGSAQPEGFTDTMFDHTFFYDSHDPERELALLDAAGFEPVISEYTSQPTSGRDKGRYIVVAQLR